MATLDTEDLQNIEAIVRRVTGGKPVDAPTAPLPRLTVRQFAVAVQLSEEVVRRKIRVQAIPRKFVFGPPYKLASAALDVFGVTQAEACQRLWEHSLLPVTSPSKA